MDGLLVMASVLSMQQGWSETEQPKFEGEPFKASPSLSPDRHFIVKGQFKPLRDSVNSGESMMFILIRITLRLNHETP